MEDNKDNRSAIKQLFTDFFEYLRLRTEDLVLGIIENVSTIYSTVFSVFVCIILAIFALAFLSAAMVWWLTQVLESFIYASLLLGLVFLLLTIIVFALRKRFISSRVVRSFTEFVSDIIERNKRNEN